MIKKSVEAVSGKVFDRLLQDNFVVLSTVMARKACFDAMGPFDLSIPAGLDYDMWVRISQHYEFAYIDVPLIRYRLHRDNLGSNFNLQIRGQEAFFKSTKPIRAYRANPIVCAILNSVCCTASSMILNMHGASIDSHKKIREAEGGYNGLDNVRGMRHSSHIVISTWFSEGGIPRVLDPTPQLVYPQTILSSTSRSLHQRFSEIGQTYPCSTGPLAGAKRLRSSGHVGSR